MLLMPLVMAAFFVFTFSTAPIIGEKFEKDGNKQENF